MVYFLIDCSKSMQGENANKVNDIMKHIVYECVPQARLMKPADFDIYFKVIGFASRFPNGILEIKQKAIMDDFNMWEPIGQNYFGTKPAKGMGLATILNELRNQQGDFNTLLPIFILISNGEKDGCEPSLEEVLKCDDKDSPDFLKAFHKALRIVISVNPIDEEAIESLNKFSSAPSYMGSRIKIYQEYQDSDSFDWDNIVDAFLPYDGNISPNPYD